MFDHFPIEWRTATEAFLSSLYERSGSEATLERYRSILLQVFAEKTPLELTRADVLAFLPKLFRSNRNATRMKPIAPAGRNIRLCVLRSYYKFCADWMTGPDTFLFTGVPPTQGITYSKPDQHYRALDEDELEAFFNAIPDSPSGRRDRSLFICFFALARRRSELISLKWGDISEATVVDANGTRRRSHVYNFRGKGKKRMLDTQEMPEYALASIIDYLEKSGRMATITPDDYVWKSTKPGIGIKGSIKGSIDGGALNPNSVNLRFKEICKAAGIAGREGLSLHSFRHSSALARFSLGSNVLEIKSLLRHSSLQTTQTYLQQLSGQADSGAQLLQRHFSFLQ